MLIIINFFLDYLLKLYRTRENKEYTLSLRIFVLLNF